MDSRRGYVNESSGRSPPLAPMRHFNGMIENCRLHDLNLHGSTFTWHRTTLWRHLDRFMVNSQWHGFFHSTTLDYLNCTRLDHALLLISMVLIRHSGFKLFHFQTMWTEHADFLNMVHEAMGWKFYLQN